MFQFMSGSEYIDYLTRVDTLTRMTDEQFIVQEIKKFRNSKKYREMVAGDDYYSGKHDILRKKRTAIGDDGKLVELHNLPNNKIVDNQYRKMVNQKSNYLVGQPFVIRSENGAYTEALKPYLLTARFMRSLKEVSKDSLNGGLGWIHPCYNEQGEFTFKRFRPFEILPMWKDADHTVLDAAVRFYEVLAYEGTEEKILTKVEVFNADGIYYFELKEDQLIPEAPFYAPYFTALDPDGIEQAFNWTKIPLIAFKYNAEEVPLIVMCKSLQDGLNKIESQWEDQMEEDPRNTIMVLVNYDGQNLGEFRQNLAQYGAVKVRSVDGSNGDVKTLQIEVNSDNYKAIIEQFKKAIVENCMGYDAKDDRIGSNANEMNLKSMYSDIELDTNGMETEYQAAFEELLWFLNCHLANIGAGDFEGEDVEIIFNRDIMINESSVINDIKNSVGLISDETLIAQHPYVDDPKEELERMQKQKEKDLEMYGGFGQDPNQNDPDDPDDDE